MGSQQTIPVSISLAKSLRPDGVAAEGFGQPQTVLYLHSSDDLYGADAILLQLVTALDPARYRPIVVLPDDMKHIGLLSHELQKAGIEYYHLPIAILRRRYLTPRGLLQLACRLIAGTWEVRVLIRRRNAGLIHGFTLAVLAAPAAAAVTGVPLTMHAHEILLGPRLLRRILHGVAVRSGRAVLCVSEAVRTHMLADEPWAANKVVVVRNGISAASPWTQSRAELRLELGVPADRPLVGMIGRVSAWKGQEVLARTAGLLRAQGVASHFVAIGGVFDGETHHMDRLREAIDAAQTGDTFTLVDFRRNARRYMAAFDIFVLPSTKPEPFGTVILEAMAAGVPVIATGCGGPPEVVENGMTGLLVPPGDAEGLAVAIRSLLDDPERARGMGEAGRRRFHACFLLERYVAGMERLYSTLLPTPRKGFP